MTCKVCGAINSGDSKFCGSCGSVIDAENTVAQQQPAVDTADNNATLDAQLNQAAAVNLETGATPEAQYQQSMNNQYAGNYQQNTQQYYQNNVQQQTKTKQPMDPKKKTVLIES